MKIILILLLTASCVSQPKYYQVTHSVTYTCPITHQYRPVDGLCHPTARVTRGKSIKVRRKAMRPLKLDCKRVFKQVNQCMGGDR